MRLPVLILIAFAGLLSCDDTPPNDSSDADGEVDVDGDVDGDVDADGDIDGDGDGDVDGDVGADGDGESDGDGCGLATGENDRRWTLTHDGRERDFFVHVPSDYDPTVPTSVVVNFHGRGSNAQQQIALSRMIALSDAEGFIAVHPNGIGATWNGGLCCGTAMNENVDDVGFTAAVIDRLAQELCIDERRVYATGMSNGGFMAHRLGCDLADRIAAIAPVAGPNGVVGCSPARVIPVFHFHGNADAIVPYDGFAGQLAVPGTMRDWAARNGCEDERAIFFSEGDVSCEEWTGCTDGVTVRLCTIDNGGHQWPGGTTIPGLGYNTSVISASEMMWDFFEGFTLP